MGVFQKWFLRLAILVLACLSAWAVCGCSDPFPPDTLVDRLRILGVRAEPPDVDLSGQCSMDALVADPAGQSRALQYTWAVCMVQITGVAKDIQCPGPDSFVFGDSASADLSVPEFVAWAQEKGFGMDLGDTDLPPDMTLDEIPLIIGLKISAPDGEQVSAIKRVRLRLTDEAQVNSNPELTGLQKQGRDWTVHLKDTVSLVPLVSDDSAQLYIPEGEQEEHAEDLVFSWYSTTGEFRDRWTVKDVSDAGEPLEENEWILPEEEDQLGAQKLWVIVRDGRWGIDWAEFGFSLNP